MANNILLDYSEKIGIERARWIDEQVLKAVPEWKRKLILRTKSVMVAKLLNVNVEIEHWSLIADFGWETVIRLNGKVLAKRKFKMEVAS